MKLIRRNGRSGKVNWEKTVLNRLMAAMFFSGLIATVQYMITGTLSGVPRMLVLSTGVAYILFWVVTFVVYMGIVLVTGDSPEKDLGPPLVP